MSEVDNANGDGGEVSEFRKIADVQRLGPAGLSARRNREAEMKKIAAPERLSHGAGSSSPSDVTYGVKMRADFRANMLEFFYQERLVARDFVEDAIAEAIKRHKRNKRNQAKGN